MTAPPRARRQPRDAGFTMVELAVATIVMGVVTSGMFVFMSNTSSNFNAVSNAVDAQAVGRFACSMLSYDAQNAGYGATPNCARDPAVVDKTSSCTPWDTGPGPGMRALFFDDQAASSAGPAAALNPQFRPDEILADGQPVPRTNLGGGGPGGRRH